MPGKLKVHKFRGRYQESPGRLNLVLSGFQKQDIVATDEVVEAIDALPNSHIEKLQIIKYDPHRKMQKLFSYIENRPLNPSVRAAYYNMDPPGIMLYRFNNLVQFYRMLYHEIGHYVQFKVIHQSTRDKWIHEIFPASTGFVSPYATKNAAEDFAECYSFFCVYPKELAKYSEKMKFMAEDIFYLSPATIERHRTARNSNPLRNVQRACGTASDGQARNPALCA